MSTVPSYQFIAFFSFLFEFNDNHGDETFISFCVVGSNPFCETKLEEGFV